MSALQCDDRRLTRNNFDLLRLLLAGTVCLVHAHQLSGFPQLAAIAGFLSSEVAVESFFVVSGFLIFMSYERSASLASYAGKRFRRIYPAYFAVVMLCAIGLAVVSTKSPGEYFSIPWIEYVLSNLVFLNFLQPTLPGVFETNLLGAVNGALWTLKIEVMFYLSVPLFVFLFRRFSTLPVLVLVYGASVAYAAFFSGLAARTGSPLYQELGRQLPGQLSYFMAGAFFYYSLPLFERYAGYFLAAAVLALAAPGVFAPSVFGPFALATIVAFCGLFLHLGNFGKYGDFSYGIYILHFPIIQILLQGGWFNAAPWTFLATVVVLTTVGAVAMWHLVEKRFLLRNSHYIDAALATVGQRHAIHGKT